MQRGIFYVCIIKGTTICRWHSLSIAINICQFITISESRALDGCYAATNDDIIQVVTILEGLTADSCHAIADDDVSQPFTILECLVTDGCHAVRDGQ